MKVFIKSLVISSLLIGASTIALAVLQTETAVAHGDESHVDSAQANDENTAGSYVYEAQPGDTYTQMARKAIQTYGIENSVNLSGAEIVHAETGVTREAGSPRLTVGQSVTIYKDAVHKWVDSAQALDDATEAKWNYYVQFVNFNTNAVGEKRSA